MSAKEMWLEIEDILKYEETKDEIRIYDMSDETEPYIVFLKHTKDIMFILYQDKDIIKPSTMIDCEILQAINKQVEELGWLGSDDNE